MTTQDDAARELEAALSTLTAEERAAYDESQAEGEDTTATVEDTEAAAAAAAKQESDDAAKTEKTEVDAAGTGADGDDKPAAAAAADAPASDAPGAAPVVQAEPAATPSAPAVTQAPAFVAEAPVDAAAKLEKIAADKAALAAKWDAGDIGAVEYQATLDGLYKDERKIEAAVLKHEMATEMATQQKLAAWQAECTSFMAAHPEYAVGTPLFDKLNGLVKALGADGSRTDSEALALAHKMVQVETGTYVPPAAAPTAKPAAPPTVKPALPPTLAGLPSAGATNPGESRFSSLDRLEGEAFEAAFAKLSAADRDAYMQQ